MGATDTAKLGLLPSTPAKPRLKLSSFIGAKLAEETPTQVDYLSKVSAWLLYENDKIGSCGPAGLAHWITASGSYGDSTPFTATTQNVLDFYSAVSGYDQLTGKSDNGVVLQEMLNVARKQGAPGGMPIVAFAEVNVADLDEVKAAINVFGHVLIGLNLPRAASAQLDAGQRWDVVDGYEGIPGGWGGHCVHVGAFGDGEFTCTTWGKTQKMTEDFWRRYCAESWIVLPEGEWITPQGVTPTGLDLHGLGEELARLTGGPNPFPAVTPTPAPVTPTPAPTSAADALDKTLWGSAQAWLRSRRYGANADVQRALTAWGRGKGLA